MDILTKITNHAQLGNFKNMPVLNAPYFDCEHMSELKLVLLT
jgi:hypothetical protein